MAILFAIALTSVLYWKRREIAEAIDNVNRRGPRPPTHPLSSADGIILNRRPGKKITPDS